MTQDIAVVILAAGKGTRMRSDVPKVLHPIGNVPMVVHAMQAASAIGAARTIVVVGHGAEAVDTAVRGHDPSAQTVRQAEQLGTGHAVACARDVLADFSGDIVVLFGDTPFISPETLTRIREARAEADVVVLGFEAVDPGRYGRLVIEGKSLEAIVEAKDATPEQLAIRICNSGVMAADCTTMMQLLSEVSNENAQGEYYLTDVVGLARSTGRSCAAVLCDEAETLGINDRVQLAQAERIFQERARHTAMVNGATLISPETVFFSFDTVIGKDVVIHPNVVFGQGVRIADRCEVKAFCHVEDTVLHEDVKIGPFARMRGGCDLSSGVRIGNFVELKNAALGEGTKAGHLTYLGDASVGSNVNFGAGTITCNYDGVLKHRTTIDDNAFIGVQTALIAPIHVGADAYVGTGSVLTRDVPEDALALSRTPQTNRDGMASRLREKFAHQARKKREAT